jgi:hypothetical protein
MYHENRPEAVDSSTTTDSASQSTLSLTSAGGWDFEIFNFDITVPAASAPKDSWKDEVKRYLLFEGGQGALDDNLLVKWKVLCHLK